MRLGDFISANIEPILVEWESFARSIWPPGAGAEPRELRDSAEEILRAIVADMATAQSGLSNRRNPPAAAPMARKAIASMARRKCTASPASGRA